MREHWLDSHHVVLFEVKEVDDSYDHEFGREYKTTVDIEIMGVIAYISNMDHDITSTFTDKQLESFKEDILEKYIRGAA